MPAANPTLIAFAAIDDTTSVLIAEPTFVNAPA
jgi:hypothetical protein